LLAMKFYGWLLPASSGHSNAATAFGAEWSFRMARLVQDAAMFTKLFHPNSIRHYNSKYHGCAA
jgi:hypothetical protein